jgi:hypothetical protein
VSGYAELIKIISETPNTQVLLSGFGSTDAEITNEIEKKLQIPCVNIVNKTSLQELIAAITLVKAMIGTDTGPTHIAAALNIPVLCISPTKFVKSLRWGPWGTKNRIVGFPEQCDFVCNPYKCSRPDCLDAIKAKEVHDNLQALLEEDEDSAPKHHWFKKSCTVMVYVSDISKVTSANALIQRLKTDEIRFEVVAKTQSIATLLNHSDYLMSSFSPFFFKNIIVRDINIIHHIGKESLWLRFLRQIIAPHIYCPPIIVYDIPESKQKLIEYYIEGFKK